MRHRIARAGGRRHGAPRSSRLVALLALALVAARGRRRQRRHRAARLGDESGSAINQLYWIVIGITAAVFLARRGGARLVHLPLPPARRDRLEADGPQIHGNTRLELIWTAIPLPDPRRDHRRHDRQGAERRGEPASGRRPARRPRRRRTSSTGSTRTRTASSRSTPCACPSTGPSSSCSTPTT